MYERYLFELLHTCCCLDVLLVNSWALRVVHNGAEVVEQALERLEVLEKLSGYEKVGGGHCV